MRDCGSCTRCCEGLLAGAARGVFFGRNKPCSYLAPQCTIYSDRPVACRDYYCGWAQGLFDIQYDPVSTGVVVSVETGSGGRQYLRASHKSDSIPADMLAELNEFCAQNDTVLVTSKVIPIAST
jgi:Fe-S-cluster containining protein